MIFLHGGPGGETSPSNAGFFDPSIYRVVLLDQRGSGKSLPTCELRNNTTAHLIQDFETIRKHLGIQKWHLVFGGSWGSSLALLYAQEHTESVSSLILRGIALCDQALHHWHDPYGGVAIFNPDACEEFLSNFEDQEKQQWLRVIYKRLTSDDWSIRVKAARAVHTFDFKKTTMRFDPSSLDPINDEEWSVYRATLSMHYVSNYSFIREGQITEKERIDKIRHLPCTIIQGREDMVCPPQGAWQLHKAWPEANFMLVPGAGHGATEPGTFEELIKACDRYAEL